MIPAMQTAVMDPTGTLRPARLAVTVATLLIVAGLGIAALRFFGGSPPEHRWYDLIGAVALGAIVAAPGVLALLARHDRPALLLPAAVVLVPLSFLSFALVTLPLLIPAVLLFVDYARRSQTRPIGGLRATALTILVLGLLVAALLALLVHQDPREYTTATAGYGTSDVITAAEALLSLALVGSSLVVGWTLAAPRRHP
jgi:hypothetical protein